MRIGSFSCVKAFIIITMVIARRFLLKKEYSPYIERVPSALDMAAVFLRANMRKSVLDIKSAFYDMRPRQGEKRGIMQARVKKRICTEGCAAPVWSAAEGTAQE